jgi:hypothetical protein
MHIIGVILGVNMGLVSLTPRFKVHEQRLEYNNPNLWRNLRAEVIFRQNHQRSGLYDERLYGTVVRKISNKALAGEF